MKKAIIYTRTGDSGTTSLMGGKRVSKDHPRVEAYGTLDELNAHLGLLAATMHEHEECSTIEQIMNNIMTLGCYLAREEVETTCPVTEESIATLEKHIDELYSHLAPLRGFILPSCDEASARANLCRTVCRRAERRIITLAQHAEISPLATSYVNRLSDYLFALSRILDTEDEKTWENHWK
ncbi:MAG: cob(I)yrinic acid a,c-diamide adenosyltransferase [Bacteroidaceae bacterium]|nr:cob(I)yrinic acid a,c-diamide adenosyltransferase [Bacteroidaceae bacterium]